MRYEFPLNLAKQVRRKWTTTIGGQYTPPPLPGDRHLQTVLEVAYLAGLETDEARHLKFTLCCTPTVDSVRRQYQDNLVEVWPLDPDRTFNVEEVKRLATVTSLDNSAIWVRFSDNPEQPLAIHGLLNLGTSWENARNAFTYHYKALPDALLVRVQAPGRLMVYQGQYLIASLQSGKLQSSEIVPIGLLGVYPLFTEGHGLLRAEIPEPKKEEPREWYEFEWLAYVNTVLAIVNSVHLRGHGGAVIFASKNCKFIEEEFVKIKYGFPTVTRHLKKHFTDFMTLRHQFGDMLWLTETKDKNARTEAEMRLTDYSLQEAQRRLAETCKFIGDLSGTDGAIALRTDLSIDGFGTEILLDKARRAKVYKVSDPASKVREKLDSEQFGMRHRSAMRLCSVVRDLAIFVISQDGGVSLVWNDNGDTCFKSGLKTTNINMALA